MRGALPGGGGPGPAGKKLGRRRAPAGVKRLLLKGQAQLSVEAAQELAQGGLLLLGVEAMSVAPDDDPAPVHRALLEREVAVLESIDLRQVPAGDYILLAQPLKYGGLDGAQVRALLVEGSLEEA